MVTSRMERILGAFQDKVVWILMGRLLRRRAYRKWDNISAEAAKSEAEAGFETVEKYISEKSKHGHTVYFCAIDSGTLRSDREEEGSTGGCAVVGTDGC